jgi:hypothetical protein
LNTQALSRLNTQAHLPVRRTDRPGPAARLDVQPRLLPDWKFHHDHHRLNHERAQIPAAANAPRRTTETKETKSAFKTTELIVFVLSVLGVLIAAAVTDNGDDGQGFGARSAWLYVTLLSIGYMISRGLAKAGSRERNDA